VFLTRLYSIVTSYSDNDMITQGIHYYRHIVLLLLVFLMSGCASLNYYAQSVQGQFEVIQKRRAISDLLDADNISDTLHTKLNTVLALREFSIRQLGLPDNNSYLSYADLERNYVIWNIFATEEFSLDPIKWCYLIVGCLNYRGYFAESDARQHATELEKQGYDIYLGGVSAYSTLGWFDDPVLNTMLRWSDIRLTTVIFHELAHQQLYIKNDTEFNEAYADAVAYIGVTRWLQQSPDKNLLTEYEQSQAQEKQFINLVMRYKSLLNEIYQSTESEDLKRKQKSALFLQMTNEYNDISRTWTKNGYQKWFSTGINNAKLAAIVTYREYVPAFIELYEKLGKNLNRFYSLTKLLSNCNSMKREEILKEREIEFEC
jgi:predicted aminopeptidase